MLRVYSIMQLQHVWMKPSVVEEDEEQQHTRSIDDNSNSKNDNGNKVQDLSASLDVVHDEPEELAGKVI